MTALATRFWLKADKDGPVSAVGTPCWQWTAATNHKGYGKIGIGQGKWGLSHRVAWLLERGEIEDGQMVLHRCDNPGCVRPDHLFLGTAQDNSNDMVAKGRSQRGESHTAAILSSQDVLDIRDAIRRGERSKDLAEKYGVSRPTIAHIKTKRTWRSNLGP